MKKEFEKKMQEIDKEFQMSKQRYEEKMRKMDEEHKIKMDELYKIKNERNDLFKKEMEVNRMNHINYMNEQEKQHKIKMGKEEEKFNQDTYNMDQNHRFNMNYYQNINQNNMNPVLNDIPHYNNNPNFYNNNNNNFSHI